MKHSFTQIAFKNNLFLHQYIQKLLLFNNNIYVTIILLVLAVGDVVVKNNTFNSTEKLFLKFSVVLNDFS